MNQIHIKSIHFFLGFLILGLLVTIPSFGVDFFDRGMEAFMNNSPEDAVAMFEIASQQDPGNHEAYLYLGISYIQLAMYERAIEAFQSGLENTVASKDDFFYNIGLAYALSGNFELALEAYSQSHIYNSGYHQAYLNKANIYVRNGEYEDAIKNYRIYLSIMPDGEQSEAVRQMIVALEEEIADIKIKEEQERIAREEEEKQRQQELEQQRIREEEERELAAQRRRDLMSSVLDSLENDAREADQIGAESEEFEDFDFEIGRQD